jgi:hypothetical protein
VVSVLLDLSLLVQFLFLIFWVVVSVLLQLYSFFILFLNKIHFHNQDQLQAEIAKTHLENEAFVKVFGKEHGGFARSKGLGVTPSQLTTTRSTRLTCSSEDNEKMKKMQDEIDSLREKASQVDILKEQVAFLMQVHNSKAN